MSQIQFVLILHAIKPAPLSIPSLDEALTGYYTGDVTTGGIVNIQDINKNTLSLSKPDEFHGFNRLTTNGAPWDFKEGTASSSTFTFISNQGLVILSSDYFL